MTPYILFEIDNGLDLNTRSRFLRHLDTLRAMGKLKHPDALRELVAGDPAEHLRPAYRISAADYVEHVLKPGWVNGQANVYQTSAFGNTYVETPDLKASLGAPAQWVQVSETSLLLPNGVWFYDPEDRFYFTIVR